MELTMSAEDNRWHLDKRLNVGHLVTTVVAVAAVFTWGSTIESRISVLESQYINSQELQREIKTELVRLNNKVDQMLVRIYENGHERLQRSH